jgi:hypothetical protein
VYFFDENSVTTSSTETSDGRPVYHGSGNGRAAHSQQLFELPTATTEVDVGRLPVAGVKTVQYQ